MIDNEIAPIAFSTFEDFDPSNVKHVPMYSFRICHVHNMNLIDTNGDVQKRRCIKMDDVFIYHAHTFFRLSMVCVGTRPQMSTSIEHELTKRALESEPHTQVHTHLPPLHDDDELSSRTTLFEGGEMI